MSKGRKKRGKLTSLTPKDKLAKRVRNEQRKRVPSAVRWEKEHVKRRGMTRPQLLVERERRALETARAIKEAVEEAAEGGMIKEARLTDPVPSGVETEPES